MADYDEMEEEEDVSPDIPKNTKDLRACLRCSMIKSYQSFEDHGCENCIYLEMQGDPEKINSCTTAHFDGMIALIKPNDSWAARWQYIENNYPGMYAVKVSGELPSHIEKFLADNGIQNLSKLQ